MKKQVFALLLMISGLISTCFCQVRSEFDIENRAERVMLERQPIPDQGNGTYKNPILSGHFHDLTVCRVGKNYYMSHCEFESQLIWHSRDLVNWQPIGRPVKIDMGNIWACDLIYYEGLYYMYMPLRLKDPAPGQLSFSNYVITAKDPAGPWSEPIDLGIGGIDPGHIATPDGRRFLYVNQGKYVELSKDGLSVISEVKKSYEGWKYPEDWVVECFCLESPKLLYKDGYYYMISAQGGTSGPSTSHMIVTARSKSPEGPWKNCPYNPMVRTMDRSEGYWTQGHGTLVDDIDGNWWVLYHAYQHGKRPLGRSSVMLPVEWTDDGWPVVPRGVKADHVLKKPAGENIGHGTPYSDDFTSKTMNPQWDWIDHGEMAGKISFGDGKLVMQAQGTTIPGSTHISCMPMNESFEASVEVEIKGNKTYGGITFMGRGEDAVAAIASNSDKVLCYLQSRPRNYMDTGTSKAWLKIINRQGDASFQYSLDGMEWKQLPESFELTSLGILRIGLFAEGEGEVTFRNFKYLGLE